MSGLRMLMLALAIAGTTPAFAQQYPAKAITIIVPFGPGGAIDTQVRVLARKLSEVLNGTPVVVENKAGAASQVGIEFAARQPPDGYTLVAVTASLPLLPVTNPSFKLDPVKDLTHITQFSKGALVLTVNSQVPAASVKDFVAYAKDNPGKLNFGTSGLSDRIAGEYFQSVTGIKMSNIPYNSAPNQVIGLIRNDTQMIFLPIVSVKNVLDDGRARALAISTKDRTPTVAGVPTIAENGYPEFDLGFWFGISAPLGLSPQVVATLHTAILAALKDPEVVGAINASGSDVVGSTPAELAAAIEHDRKMLSDIARTIAATSSQ